MRRNLFRFAVVAVTAGCTVINSLDDVTKIPEPSMSATDAAVVPLPSTPAVDAAPVDAGSDTSVAPLNGAIVVAGELLTDTGKHEPIVTVLDPVTGAEIAPTKREQLTLAAVRYDGLRDLWYLFESSNGDFVPGPTDNVILHVRQLDGAGNWTELSKTTLPPIQFFESIAVLRERLGYVAYAAPDSGSSFQFVILDTSNPAAITQLDPVPLVKAPNAALGTRSSTGPGGIVNLVQVDTNSCDGSICDVITTPIRVPNNGQPITDPVVALTSSTRTAFIAAAAYPQRELDLLVIPRLASDAGTTARLFAPVTHQPEGDPSSTFVTDTGIRRPAIAECQGIAFIVGTNGDLNLHAIPLTGNGTGTPTKVSTQHSGQAVYFEPYTQTALATYNQGAGFDYGAFRLGGTSTAPTLARRDADWKPPADVRPILLGIRSPVPLSCP